MPPLTLSRPPQLSCLAPTNVPPFHDTKALSAIQAACSTTAALATDPGFQVVKRLLPSLLDVSPTSMSTWWFLCLLYKATHTCSLWWISCFGVPATVASDQGSQFTSSSWSAFCRSVGIQHVMTTAYHHSMVERMHRRRLKAALALGPPRPQERASGAVWHFFHRIRVWHTADSPWTVPVDARASANGVS